MTKLWLRITSEFLGLHLQLHLDYSVPFHLSCPKFSICVRKSKEIVARHETTGLMPFEKKKAQLNPANYYRTKLNHLVYVKLIPVGELWINKYCKWFIVTCCRCVHVVPLHFIHDTHAMPSRINGMGASEGLMGGFSWHANCILSLFRLVWSIFMTNYRRKTKEIVTTFGVGTFCWILLGLAGGRSCEWRF